MPISVPRSGVATISPYGVTRLRCGTLTGCSEPTRTGVPCWVDAEQPDPDAAHAFYGGLFGWTFEDAMPPGAPGSYADRHAGRARRRRDRRGRGRRAAAWNTYVAVDDADDAALGLVPPAGASLASPADAGPGGRCASAPTRRARFRLWQAAAGLGAQVVNEPGSWNFSDLHTADPATAPRSTRRLFGWAFDDLGFATLIRRPGYGDHLEATIDPGIRERQAGRRRAARFRGRDRLDGAARRPTSSRTGTCRSRSPTATTRPPPRERLGADRARRPRTRDGRGRRSSATRRARCSPLSQFTPPGG